MREGRGGAAAGRRGAGPCGRAGGPVALRRLGARRRRRARARATGLPRAQARWARAAAGVRDAGCCAPGSTRSLLGGWRRPQALRGTSLPSLIVLPGSSRAARSLGRQTGPARVSGAAGRGSRGGRHAAAGGRGGRRALLRSRRGASGQSRPRAAWAAAVGRSRPANGCSKPASSREPAWGLFLWLLAEREPISWLPSLRVSCLALRGA